MSKRPPDLNGFQSFRTPNSDRAVDLEPHTPKRLCECGKAYLRPSNPGPCGACSGTVDIPEWAEMIVTLDARPSTVQAVAALLTGHNRMTQIKQRNVAIREAFASGRTPQQLHEDTGISRPQIHAILNHEKDPNHKSNTPKPRGRRGKRREVETT